MRLAEHNAKRVNALQIAIALVMLAQGSADYKSDIIVHMVLHQRGGLEDKNFAVGGPDYQILTKADLRLVLTTIVSVPLIALPLFATDFPSPDKRGFFKIMQEWPMRVEPLVESIRLAIAENSVTGRVPASQFSIVASRINLYDVRHLL